MERLLNAHSPISHFGENVKPFPEKIFLVIEAQNEADVKRFLKKISEIIESWAAFEEKSEKLTEAYFDTVVKTFLGEYPPQLVPELLDSYSDWLEDYEQRRADYVSEVKSLLISYNVRFVKGFPENFFDFEVSG